MKFQIAVSGKDGRRVYLNGTGIASDIYMFLALALKRIAVKKRLDDEEFVARVIFMSMFTEVKPDSFHEVDFGIGTGVHGDLCHMLPVVNCKDGTVSFENPPVLCGDVPAAVDFKLFYKKAIAGGYSSFYAPGMYVKGAEDEKLAA